MASYSLLLVVHDEWLLELARIIEAPYAAGSFERAVKALYDADEDEATWMLRGVHATFSVLIERGEGYLSCSISGEGARWQEAKELMWRRFLDLRPNLRGVRDPWGRKAE